MSIKYYHLAKDEEPPDEFCAVRDIGGEPSEYTFYVPETENAKLREYATKLEQANIVLSSDNCDLKNDMRDMQFFIAENAKLREYAKLMYGHIKECCDACGERDICDVDALTRSLSDAMQLLYIDMYGEPLGAE